MDDVNFESLGFKCGLEIHQQLTTERKLFCRCAPEYRNDPPHYRILRHMRPTLSEMGTYDGTALMEFKTKKNVTYEFYRENCSYEIDDTPPFEMDEKALEISLVIAAAMNCSLVDEVHVSRKQYLDGSIPTGFQRTAIISLGGWVPWKDGRKIEIRQISLEEDACREMGDRGHEVIFRTDRLSIPLIEVVTEPNAKNPKEAGEMAEVLGWVMRSTRLVNRGPGATRQDVNVSIEGGQRVEIKGVPYLELIPTVTAGEAIRQHNLLKIKDELEKRGLSPDDMDTDDFTDMTTADLTEHFGDRDITLLDEWKEDDKEELKIGAVLLRGFRSVFSHPTHGDQTFADEVAGRLRVIACLDRMPNLYTSDDETFGGIEEEDIDTIMKELGGTEDDSFALVWGPKQDVETGLKEVYIRSKEAFFGVPNETRQVNSRDTTTFERILPGPDRMYPDTDRPPIVVGEDMLDRVRAQVPRHYGQEEDDMVENGVPPVVAHRLVVTDHLDTYKEAVSEGADPKLTAITLVEKLRALSRKGYDVYGLSDSTIKDTLVWASKGKITTQAVEQVLKVASSHDMDIPSVVEKECLEPIDEVTMKRTVKDLIPSHSREVSEFKEGRFGPLMGAVMEKVGPRFEGVEAYRLVSDIVSMTSQ